MGVTYWLRMVGITRPPLSANRSMNHWVVAKHRKHLKALAWTMAGQAQLPRLDEHITVTLVYNPPDSNRRDEDNLFPTLKPMIDGLVAWGLVPDDDHLHVHSECRIGPVRRPGEVWLKIEVTENAVHAGDAPMQV